MHPTVCIDSTFIHQITPGPQLNLNEGKDRWRPYLGRTTTQKTYSQQKCKHSSDEVRGALTGRGDSSGLDANYPPN